MLRPRGHGSHWCCWTPTTRGAITGRSRIERGPVALMSDGVHRQIGPGQLWNDPPTFLSVAGRYAPQTLVDQVRRHETDQDPSPDDTILVVVLTNLYWIADLRQTTPRRRATPLCAV